MHKTPPLRAVLHNTHTRHTRVSNYAGREGGIKRTDCELVRLVEHNSNWVNLDRVRARRLSLRIPHQEVNGTIETGNYALTASKTASEFVGTELR